jgi:hypothetical protein
MTQKQLLITSAYPSTEEGEKILISVLERLNQEFDVLLATHCPVSKQIQSMVKYFVYDHRNEMLDQDYSVHFWADFPSFFFKIHKEESKHHSYAVFRSLMNAIYLMKDYYTDFIYLEGDCLFSEQDINKLKQFRTICQYEKKEAVFFKYPEFLSSLVFYSKMDFFRNVYQFPKTAQEYEEVCKSLGSYGTLENFLYKSIESKGALPLIYAIENTKMADFFDTSNLGINTFLDGKVVYQHSYFTDVARIEGTVDKMAFCYLTNESRTFDDPVDIYVDEEKIITLPTGSFATVVPIRPINENFSVRFGSHRIKKYNKSRILDPARQSIVKIK